MTAPVAKVVRHGSAKPERAGSTPARRSLPPWVCNHEPCYHIGCQTERRRAKHIAHLNALRKALKNGGRIRAIGGTVYDCATMEMLMSTSDLVKLRHMVRRTDSGGSPTWEAAPGIGNWNLSQLRKMSANPNTRRNSSRT